MTEEAAKALPVAHRTLRDFLENASAFSTQEVTAKVEFSRSRYQVEMPEVLLFCGSPLCGRDSFFDAIDSEVALGGGDGKPASRLEFIRYRCRHCKKSLKTYALRIDSPGGDISTLNVMKYGENPAAIGPTSKALRDLLGDQWTMYLQGRRSELNGLGIGAYAYYRRVVEHIWHRVLTRLIEVAKLENSQERTSALTASQAEEQFTRSMDAAKAFVPVSLFVSGHNPFQALYDACGDAIHEYTDAECLARSQIIRVVLSRFSERAQLVLSDDVELRTAVGSLVNLGSKDSNI